MNTQKKKSVRKCVGCKVEKPKNELIRIVKTKIDSEKYEIIIDKTGKKSGRGVYICYDSNCYKKALKSKRIERALNANIPADVYENLDKILQTPQINEE